MLIEGMMEAKEAVISFSVTKLEEEAEIFVLLLMVLGFSTDDGWSSLLMPAEPNTLRTTLRGRPSTAPDPTKPDDDDAVEYRELLDA